VRLVAIATGKRFDALGGRRLETLRAGRIWLDPGAVEWVYLNLTRSNSHNIVYARVSFSSNRNITHVRWPP
jgi:predicted site-specific integrase-resolvase